jgi:hypothetical protein
MFEYLTFDDPASSTKCNFKSVQSHSGLMPIKTAYLKIRYAVITGNSHFISPQIKGEIKNVFMV